MTKRSFTIDTGKDKIDVEGHEHKNVAVKYLMKRRRSLLSTKDPSKGREAVRRASHGGQDSREAGYEDLSCGLGEDGNGRVRWRAVHVHDCRNLITAR